MQWISVIYKTAHLTFMMSEMAFCMKIVKWKNLFSKVYFKAVKLPPIVLLYN